MCNEAVDIDPLSLAFIPDHFKTAEMRIEALRMVLYPLPYVPDQCKTLEICEKAVEDDPWLLKYVPDHFKTQEICERPVEEDLSSLQYVPDMFVTQEQIDLWYDDSEYYDDKDEDNFFKWYHSYKKQKTQKASIKEEFLPIAWHPSKYWDWYMSEDEKRDTEVLWA